MSTLPPPPPRGLPVLEDSGAFIQPWSGWFRKLWTVAGAAVNLFTATTPGIVPASGGGVINFLRADGTWTAPGGGGGGTVTSVTAGDGLTASPNPIVGAGTISLQNRFADSMLLMGA